MGKYNIMNKFTKKLWIKALRSDKYEQGQHQLRDFDDRFCCLGVLCDLVEPESWSDLSVAGNGFYHNYESGEPSSSIVKGAGLTEYDIDNLVFKNDDNGLDFKEIADWIEANL